MKIIFCLLILFTSANIFPQQPSDYQTLLDSVKLLYGEPCQIGVASRLIYRLEKYHNFPDVKKYLNTYDSLHAIINNFRTRYKNEINDDPAMLLGVSRIFNGNSANIVNAAGIYLGPDSLTNVGLTYIIIHNNIDSYIVGIIQIANFDKIFRTEICEFGADWYNSLKLKDLKGFPFNNN